MKTFNKITNILNNQYFLYFTLVLLFFLTYFNLNLIAILYLVPLIFIHGINIIIKLEKINNTKPQIIKNQLLYSFNENNQYDEDSFLESFNDLIEKGQMVGVIYGGNTSDTTLQNISFTLRNLDYIKGNFYADVLPLDTTNGKEFQKAINGKTNLKFVPRVLVTNNKVKEIFTFDVVI